jgi:hypothetical protein
LGWPALKIDRPFVRRLQFPRECRQSPRRFLTQRQRICTSASAAKVCSEFDHDGHILSPAVTIRAFVADWQSACLPADSFDSAQNHLSANDLPPPRVMRPLLSKMRVRGAICTMQLQIANPDRHSTSGETPEANYVAPHAEISPIRPPIVT